MLHDHYTLYYICIKKQFVLILEERPGESNVYEGNQGQARKI